MKLLNIILDNFQGVKHIEINIDGKDCSIYGTNGTGKTTIFNAITWLLFNKSSVGAKSFTPKTTNESGVGVHNLEHSVFAKIELDNGSIISLKKIFKEKWEKKRGSSKSEHMGHTTDYYIDDVPVKEKEYLSRLNEIALADRMMALMKTDIFAEEWNWIDRRRTLLDICGDISDEDVINNNPSLSDLKAYLKSPGINKTYTVDEYIKIAHEQKKNINIDLKQIPQRIDEANRARPETPDNIDISHVEAKLKELTNIKSKQEDELQSLKMQASFENPNDIQIRKLEIEISDAKRKYINECDKQNEDVCSRIANIRSEMNDISENISRINNDIFTQESKLARAKQSRNEYQILYNQIKSHIWSGNDVCVTCNRPIPKDEIEKSKEIFNLDKSNRLEEIKLSVEAECSKPIISALEGKIISLKNDINKQIEQSLKFESKLKDAVLSQQEIKPFEQTSDYFTITGKINAIKASNANDHNTFNDNITTLHYEIRTTSDEIERLNRVKAKLSLAENQRKRIKELEQQEKQLASDYENIEKGIYLCEEYIRTKVSMLDENINSRFKSVKFKLIEEQMNGGHKEVCEVLVPSDSGNLVPYSIANNAARVNAGLEIINTLVDYWGINIPIIIDNAESIVSLIDTNSQIIRLVVSEKDETLRTEVIQKEK